MAHDAKTKKSGGGSAGAAGRTAGRSGPGEDADSGGVKFLLAGHTKEFYHQ